MKTRTLFAFLAVVLFASCSKNSSDTDKNGSGAISAKIDGTNTTFNVNAKAMRNNGQGFYTIQIAGATGSEPSTANQITLAIASDAEITPGTYTEDASTNSKLGTIGYVTGGSETYTSDGSDTNPVTVIITSVNSTSIQGTFRGDVYLTTASGASSTKKVFSEGTFNVNF
jgi:hypothetical protein